MTWYDTSAEMRLDDMTFPHLSPLVSSVGILTILICRLCLHGCIHEKHGAEDVDEERGIVVERRGHETYEMSKHQRRHEYEHDRMHTYLTHRTAS